MPVEIQELVVRVVVDPPRPARAGGGGAEAGDARAELVEEVVAQVLAVLREREDR
jgi:hypothetical protein